MKFIHLNEMSLIKNNLLDRVGVKAFTIWLSNHGVTANHITIFHQIAHLLSAYFLFENTTVFAILYMTHWILDIYDGYYAKTTNKVSPTGELLDHGFDFIGGLLILIKSIFFGYAFWGIANLLMLPILITLIVIFKKTKELFPPMNYPFFFIFEAYNLGLIVNLVIQIGLVVLMILIPETKKILLKQYKS